MKITIESVKRTAESQQLSVVRSQTPDAELHLIPAVNCWANVIRPLRGLTCLYDFFIGLNWGMWRPAAESSINLSNRLSLVSSCLALTTHQLTAFRYEGG